MYFIIFKLAFGRQMFLESIKILHTSDIHLKASKKDVSTLVFADIIKIASIKQVQALVISGDLFDSAFNSRHEKNLVAALFEKIPDVRVFICGGNHDYYQTFSGIDFPENVHVFGPKVERVSLGPADFYGVSFSSAHDDSLISPDFCVADRDKINVFAVHGDCGGNSSYNSFSISSLKNSGIDYLALGHLHSYSRINRVFDMYYAYPGTPQGQGFDETGTKGVILAELSKKTSCFHFIKTSRMVYTKIDVDISQAFSYSDITDLIRSAAPEKSDAWQVNLVGENDNFYDVNLDYLSVLLSDFTNLRLLNSTEMEINLEKIKNDYTLKGVFASKALEMGLDRQTVKIALCALRGKKVDL